MGSYNKGLSDLQSLMLEFLQKQPEERLENFSNKIIIREFENPLSEEPLSRQTVEYSMKRLETVGKIEIQRRNRWRDRHVKKIKLKV